MLHVNFINIEAFRHFKWEMLTLSYLWFFFLFFFFFWFFLFGCEIKIRVGKFDKIQIKLKLLFETG